MRTRVSDVRLNMCGSVAIGVRTLCVSLALLLAFQGCASQTASQGSATTNEAKEKSDSTHASSNAEHTKSTQSLGEDMKEGLLRGLFQGLLPFAVVGVIITAPICGPIWLIKHYSEKGKEQKSDEFGCRVNCSAPPSDKVADSENPPSNPDNSAH